MPRPSVTTNTFYHLFKPAFSTLGRKKLIITTMSSETAALRRKRPSPDDNPASDGDHRKRYGS